MIWIVGWVGFVFLALALLCLPSRCPEPTAVAEGVRLDPPSFAPAPRAPIRQPLQTSTAILALALALPAAEAAAPHAWHGLSGHELIYDAAAAHDPQIVWLDMRADGPEPLTAVAEAGFTAHSAFAWSSISTDGWIV